jgi:dTDP-4-amino-4,6-dideoxygalactose transaminase
VRVPFYDIRAQYEELQEPLDAAVHEVISSGNYVMGQNHKAIEQDLAALHQVKHAIAVNSGTDALRIMLDCAGVGPGDEVITTAFTFVASTEVIVQAGATPVFVDIIARNYNIDPARIEAAITPRTKAIMPIHLFGQMCDMEPIMEIAKRHNLVILEDAAQAVGCQHKGRPPGKWGQSAGLSFYVTKNLGAAGDGGMILTDDDRVAEMARSIRVHGMGRERYYYDHVGYTSRMHEIQAAVLHVKFTRFGIWQMRRQQIATLYQTLLQNSGIAIPTAEAENVHTWHQFAIRHPRRDELQGFLKERGVDSMIYYPVPLHHHEPYKRFTPSWSLDETERAAKEILNLPIHPHLSDEQIAHVCQCLVEFGG